MEHFKNEILKGLREELSSDYEIQTFEVTKRNDLVKNAITIRKSNVAYAITMYFDDFYRKYQEGMEVSEICDEICNQVHIEEIKSTQTDWITSLIEKMDNFEKVKDNLAVRLINFNRNSKYLKDAVYRKYLDLAECLYIYIYYSDIDYSASIKVTRQMMKKWGISEDMIFDAAERNMPANFPYKIINVIDVVNKVYRKDSFSKIMPPPDLSDLKMIALTTERCVDGAVAILYSGLLKDIAEKSGNRHLILIPSSVNEFLIIPMTERFNDFEELKKMIKSVNETCVSADEILGDNPYVYDSKTDEIRIFDEKVVIE